jgi:putative endonuclease
MEASVAGLSLDEVASTAMPGGFIHALVRALDRFGEVVGAKSDRAQHLVTGSRGEDAAYFHLRSLGYTMVARNFRSPRRRGEIDLIGWDGETLCFIEVKTRSSRAVMPAEAAVDSDKQDDLRLVAREYLHRVSSDPQVRFDVISVYLHADTATPEIELFKNAFAVR